MKNFKKKYTDEMIRFVKDHVKTNTDKEIAEMMSEKWGMSITKSAVTNLKNKKNIKSNVKRGTFEAGHTPFNKGKKGLHNVGGNRTSFKKGQIPPNWAPIGTERIDRDGYVLIKVKEHGKSNQCWKLKSRVVWEKHYGKPPGKGNKIIYIDGDPTNLKIENMRLVTSAELAVLNKFNLKKNDPELLDTGIVIAKIKIAEGKRKRKKRGGSYEIQQRTT